MRDLARPTIANVLRWASRPTDDGDVRDFLNKRLLVYFRTMAAFYAVMWLLGAGAVLALAPARFFKVHEHPAKIVNVLMVVALAALWGLLRRYRLSNRALRAVEFGALLSMSLGIAIGSMAAPPGMHLELAALLIFIFVLILRSALVPSVPLWTAFLGVLCSVPVVAGGYRLAQGSTYADFVTPKLIAGGMAVWCVATTGATTVVSYVIYGLVTQVREVLHLGQYLLREKIGEGGMGEVYRAEHAMLRRPTAIKLLLPGRVSAEALARFEREVQLTSRLSHPNTIAIYDYGRTPDGIFYYAMEYLDGVSLDVLIGADGPQTDGRVVRVLLQVAGALAEAHATGLIHRDVKPANIMVCERGGAPLVKVFDFGLVKKIDGGGEQVALTHVNAITGTPLYLAPEAITEPDHVDGRIDIYALGAVGYFLLTGAPPFEGRTVVEICSHHLHTAPEPPSTRIGRAIAPKLEALVLSCLAKDPGQRPRDAQELLARLSECEHESPHSAAEARAWWSEFRRRTADVRPLSADT